MIKQNLINPSLPGSRTRGGSEHDADGNLYSTIFVSTRFTEMGEYVPCNSINELSPRVYEVFTENLHSDKAFNSSGGTLNLPDSCYSDWWARTGAAGAMNNCSTNDDVDDTAPGTQSLRNSIGHHYNATCEFSGVRYSGWWDAPDHHMCPDGFTAGELCQWTGISSPKQNVSMSFLNDDITAHDTNSSNGNGRAMTGLDYNCVTGWGRGSNSYGKMCDDGGFPALDNEDGNAAWSSGCFNLYPNGYYQASTSGANGYPNGECDADGGMCVWPAAMWDAILWKEGNEVQGNFNDTLAYRGHWGVSRVGGDHHSGPEYDHGGGSLSFDSGKKIYAAGIRCIKEWGVGCPDNAIGDVCNRGEYPPDLPEWPAEITWSSGWTSCDRESCFGCTDSDACNYDPDATIDMGNCEYTSCLYYGCTDPFACNYDPTATQDHIDFPCNMPDFCELCDGENTGPTPLQGYDCVDGSNNNICHPGYCVGDEGPPWVKSPWHGSTLNHENYRNTYRFHDMWATEDLFAEMYQKHWIGAFHPTEMQFYHDPMNYFEDLTAPVLMGDQQIFADEFGNNVPTEIIPLDIHIFHPTALGVPPMWKAWRNDGAGAIYDVWPCQDGGSSTYNPDTMMSLNDGSCCNYSPVVGDPSDGNPEASIFDCHPAVTEPEGLYVDRSACAQSNCRLPVLLADEEYDELKPCAEDSGDGGAPYENDDGKANISSFPNCGLEIILSQRDFIDDADYYYPGKETRPCVKAGNCEKVANRVTAGRYLNRDGSRTNIGVWCGHLDCVNDPTLDLLLLWTALGDTGCDLGDFPGAGSFHCAGALVAPSWVLTAGHCCVSINDPYGDNWSEWIYDAAGFGGSGGGINSPTGMFNQAVIGMHGTDWVFNYPDNEELMADQFSKGQETMAIDGVILHPDYVSGLEVWDFCLLHLATPAPRRFKPIRLNTSKELEMGLTGCNTPQGCKNELISIGCGITTPGIGESLACSGDCPGSDSFSTCPVGPYFADTVQEITTTPDLSCGDWYEYGLDVCPMGPEECSRFCSGGCNEDCMTPGEDPWFNECPSFCDGDSGGPAIMYLSQELIDSHGQSYQTVEPVLTGLVGIMPYYCTCPIDENNEIINLPPVYSSVASASEWIYHHIRKDPPGPFDITLQCFDCMHNIFTLAMVLSWYGYTTDFGPQEWSQTLEVWCEYWGNSPQEDSSHFCNWVEDLSETWGGHCKCMAPDGCCSTLAAPSLTSMDYDPIYNRIPGLEWLNWVALGHDWNYYTNGQMQNPQSRLIMGEEVSPACGTGPVEPTGVNPDGSSTCAYPFYVVLGTGLPISDTCASHGMIECPGEAPGDCTLFGEDYCHMTNMVGGWWCCDPENDIPDETLPACECNLINDERSNCDESIFGFGATCVPGPNTTCITNGTGYSALIGLCEGGDNCPDGWIYGGECWTDATSCPTGYFNCGGPNITNNGHCVPNANVCDGQCDCETCKDENDCG